MLGSECNLSSVSLTLLMGKLRLRDADSPKAHSREVAKNGLWTQTTCSRLEAAGAPQPVCAALHPYPQAKGLPSSKDH